MMKVSAWAEMTGQPMGNMLTPAEKRRFLGIVAGFHAAHVLVIGDFILDQFVWGSVSRISPEAPVPVVDVKRESYMPGGSLNVAHNIRSLSGKAYPCGVVGRDLYGRMLLKAIRQQGIETGGIVYDPTRPTTLKTRVIAHSQQMVRFDRERTGDVSRSNLDKILKFVKQKIREIDVVILEDYGKGVMQPFLLREVVKLCKKLKKPVLVDPKEKHFDYYTGVTCITPNRKEAYGGYERMVGYRRKMPDLEQVGWALIKKLRLGSVLITLGEDGMALFERGGKITKVPTAAREVYDVSGAGDTVIATLALSLAAGARMQEAAKIANMAAGIVVGKLGTATASPAELREAIRQA
ncbi:MAG TPA: D-glycero-beta-D-manno-heptose-7-phosphate kinase [Candidatus Omnitrophota bacterium]|jgi:D-beta-D-heptose 7-phosphate kinase/D-beta-D-heptose 1-phosphate adenosyltransferase|nr:D-glycero-beta-D-manno-heptose-7-phosphate kinase [Candidatus Omnitrophota bacterium]